MKPGVNIGKDEMKIILDIPDWAMNGHLQLISNHMEQVAEKKPGKDSPFYIKADRCNRCTECCLSVGPEFAYYDEKAERCKYLIKNGESWECIAGPMRLVKCTDDPPQGKYDNCSITYKVQKQNG